MLQEEWTEPSKVDESIVSFLTDTYRRMEEARDVATQNEEASKQVMKDYYDKLSKKRSLEEGQLVLVLLPTSTNKLLAKWSGPYPVLHKLSDTTYRVQTGTGRKGCKTLHINMLQEWKTPTAVCLYTTVAEQNDLDEFPDWKRPPQLWHPHIGPELDSTQKTQIQHVLHKHRKAFSTKPGRTAEASISIQTGDASPLSSPPRRLPKARLQTVQEEVAELLREGLIEPSTSPWASPIVLVPKKDGTHRLCIDYRRLNEVTQADQFPMPRIEELIDGLAGATYISTIDLTKGYWQVPVAKDSIEKTAFTTPFGKYQFLVMPFGLVGAPSVFQRLMTNTFADSPHCTAAYMDDVVVFSETWHDHLIHLDQAIARLNKTGLSLKLEKCHFGMKECTYLGHQVGRGVVKPLQAKVDAIQAFMKPKKKKDVWAFLGLSGYYRKFVQNYATRAAPLTDLTRKENPDKVQWEECHQLALDDLKRALTLKPVLRGPDFSKEFLLHTDASNVGVGAVLSQLDEDGDDRPVAFYSKKLKKNEVNYAAVEKECLAIIEGIRHFEVYLTGVRFTVITDHNCLKYLNSMKDIGGRLTRKSLQLQPYEFKIKHRPGDANGNADGLSRQAWDEDAEENTQALLQEGGGGSVEDRDARKDVPNLN